MNDSEQSTPEGQCTLWRVSFSYAEKKIMRAADYTAAEHSKTYRKDVLQKTYRKDVLRTLKSELNTWKSSGHDLPDISSYVIKTAALYLFEKYDENVDWAKDKIWQRHIDALKFLLEIFQLEPDKRKLCNFFLPDYNILERLNSSQDNGVRQCRYICSKIKTALACYEK